jgi:hypothetical protein
MPGSERWRVLVAASLSSPRAPKNVYVNIDWRLASQLSVKIFNLFLTVRLDSRNEAFKSKVLSFLKSSRSYN